MDEATLRSLEAAGDLDTIVLAGVDHQGRLFGKSLVAEFLLDSRPPGTFASMAGLADDIQLQSVEGLSFAGPAGATAQPDVFLRPDYSTARLLPWRERTALALADIVWPDGDDLPTNPVESLQALTSSRVLHELLGRDLVSDLATFAQAELRTYFHEVTDWERQAYLEQV